MNRYAQAVFACVLCFVLFFPYTAYYPSPGLDPSYQYALNAAHEQGLVHGRDIFFTYGPLGHLLLPFDIGRCLKEALLFRVVAHLLFCGGVAVLAYGACGLVPVACFIAGYAITLLPRTQYEFHIGLIHALWLFIALLHRRRAPLIVFLAGAACGFLLHAKFTMGIAAAANLAAFVLLLAARERPAAVRAVALAGIGFALAQVLLRQVHYLSFGNMLRWFQASMAFSSGYSEAMSLAGPAAELAPGLLALAVCVALLGATFRSSPRTALFLALTAPLGLFAFKYSFVRHDAHVLTLPAVLAGILALSFMTAARRREYRLAFAGYLLVGAVSLPLLATYEPTPEATRQRIDLLTGRTGLRAIRNLRWFTVYRASLRESSAHALRVMRLPESEAAAIGQATADVVPWELSIIAANRLRWRPHPTLQLYTAYTAGLDALNARYFAGTNAAEVVIVHSSTIDGRNTVWDAPAAWRELLSRYRAEARIDKRGLLILRRGGSSEPRRLVPVSETRVLADEWLHTPPVTHRLYAGIGFDPTWFGRLAAAFFRIPPVHIELRDPGQPSASYRVMPSLAREGLLLSNLPTQAADLARLQDSTAPIRTPEEIRITGPGAKYYRQPFRVEWLRDDDGCRL